MEYVNIIKSRKFESISIFYLALLMAHIEAAFVLRQLGLTANIINEIYRRTLRRPVYRGWCDYDICTMKAQRNKPTLEDPTTDRTESILEAIKQWYWLEDTRNYFKRCFDDESELTIRWWSFPHFGQIVFYNRPNKYSEDSAAYTPVTFADPKLNNADSKNRTYYIHVEDFKDFKRKLKQWAVKYYWKILTVTFEKNDRRMESSVGITVHDL